MGCQVFDAVINVEVKQMANTRSQESLIINLLHAFTRFEIVGGELDAYFDGDDVPTSHREYVPGSFTKELLLLIEKHMLNPIRENDNG